MEVVRRYFIVIRLDAAEAPLWDEQLAEVLNSLAQEYKGGQAVLLGHLLRKAVEAGSAGESNSIAQKALQKLKQLEQESGEREILSQLLRRMGLEDFVAWCEEEKIDWEKFLEQLSSPGYGSSGRRVRWTHRALNWLNKTLTHPLSTDQVRSLAIREGLISESPSDWAKLRNLASRYGFTSGHKGLWERPGFCNIVTM